MKKSNTKSHLISETFCNVSGKQGQKDKSTIWGWWSCLWFLISGLVCQPQLRISTFILDSPPIFGKSPCCSWCAHINWVQYCRHRFRQRTLDCGSILTALLMPMSSLHCFGIDMEKQSEAPHVKQSYIYPHCSQLTGNTPECFRVFVAWKRPHHWLNRNVWCFNPPSFSHLPSSCWFYLPLCFMVSVVNPTNQRNTIDGWYKPYKPSNKKDVCINYWVSNPICSMEHLHFSTPQKSPSL